MCTHERELGGRAEGEGEPDCPLSKEPDRGLNLRTQGSLPELKVCLFILFCWGRVLFLFLE